VEKTVMDGDRKSRGDQPVRGAYNSPNFSKKFNQIFAETQHRHSHSLPAITTLSLTPLVVSRQLQTLPKGPWLMYMDKV